MKKTILFSLLVITSFVLQAQSDAIALFRYKAKIACNGKTFIQVAVPTTPFLFGYLDKFDDNAFVVAGVKDAQVNQMMASHLSADFWNDGSEFFRNLYMKSPDGILVRLYEDNGGQKKKKPVDILVAFDDIKFSYEVVDKKRALVIDLGTIKI